MNLKFWSRFLYAGQKTFSVSSRGRWAGRVEITVASLLILGGFIFFVAVLAVYYLYSEPAENRWAYSPAQLAIRLSLAVLALTIGLYRLFAALWKVNVSRDRRESSQFASTDSSSQLARAGENAYPNVPPSDQPLTRGSHLKYRLAGRKRFYGWLFLAGVAMLVSLTLATLSATRFFYSMKSAWDWSALAMSLVSSAIGTWSTLLFFRQALQLAAFGPTTLEISERNLVPGQKYRVMLLQPGRFRFKLLDVELRCEEISTFTRGTDIQTERRVVVEQRLFRQRGINVTPSTPFADEFEFELPATAYHSFTSENNQVQWKIVVTILAKGWPHFEQTFPIVVCPPTATVPSL